VDQSDFQQAQPCQTHDRESFSQVIGEDVGKADLIGSIRLHSVTEIHKMQFVIERSWTGPLFYWPDQKAPRLVGA
jgi:hypothetical protein